MNGTLGLFVAFTLVGVADAQGLGPPAEQVGEFERMLGHWEGQGELWAEPGADPTPWTAKEHVQWILDGNFVQEDLEIHAGFPTALSMRAVYGWDTNTGKYVSFGTSNMGDTFLDDAFWIDDTFVINRATVERGQPLLERVSLTYDDRSYEMTIERAIGAGAFHTHAHGKFTKVDAPTAPPTIATSAPIAPAPKAMMKLSGTIGDWKVTGKMRPMPGMPEMPVASEEHARSLFGGSCVVTDVIGEPSPMGRFRGLGFTTWNARTKAYEHTWFDNMGSVQASTGHFEGDELVFQFAGMEYGFPISSRSVMSFDEEGRVTGFCIDRTANRGDVERSFEVTYAPMK